MQSIASNGITIYFEVEDRPTAELIRPTVDHTARVLQARYDIEQPRQCRVYVMRSWQRMFFHAAPLRLKLYFTLTYPFLLPRANRIWSIAGGWAFPMGKRRVTGIKPPDLIQTTKRSIGSKIFLPEPDISEKIRQITSHELTHAFTTRARRHMWLYEGIAMRVADHVANCETVRRDTLDSLASRIRDVKAGRNRRVDLSNPDALIYVYARGYWLTRYLEDTNLVLLRDLLQNGHSRRELERELAGELDIDPDAFWPRINTIVLDHFDQ